MGVAMAPVGLASLIGSPIAGGILGKDLVWWKGITFASVRSLVYFINKSLSPSVKVCLIAASFIEILARHLYIKREVVLAKHDGLK